MSYKEGRLIEIGVLNGLGGAISINYLPERDVILLYAYNPDDLRIKGVFLELNADKYRDLKTIISKVDAAIQSEIQKRLENQTTDSKRIKKEGFILVSLSGSNVSVPEDLYNEAYRLVSEGKTMLAASHINKSLDWISLSGAKELAQAICEQQQSGGIRE